MTLGIIGLGQRGSMLLHEILKREDVDVTWVCDLYEDRAQAGQAAVKIAKGTTPHATTDAMTVIHAEDTNCLLIATSWNSHVSLLKEAMNVHKPTAFEVGGAYSIEECFELVELYEKTKTPVMMLENCCYGRLELLALNMCRKGLLGDIVHMEGGYRHDLRAEVTFGEQNRHYRLQEYLNRNCENYPTHEIGPIAKILDINRGNRMVSLVSVSSKAAGLSSYINNNENSPENLKDKAFAQGDVVTTIIKCAGGQTITITLDTTLPRYYSRGFMIQGTRGMICEDNASVFIDGQDNAKDFCWNTEWNNIEKYYEQYDHRLWKEGRATGGHGGIDGLVLSAFFDAVKEKKPMPIDIYDAVTWMAITPLSEISIKNNAVVEFPDFTHGMWQTKERADIE